MTAEYIAGFIDGEGTIQITGNRVRITIPQTNFEVLEEIRNFLGVGKVFKEKKRQAHWKDSWVYYTTNTKDTCKVLELIKTYLIVKKDRAFEALEVLKKWDERVALNRFEDKKILELVKQGISYRDIQKKFNINRGKVYRAVKNEGVV